MRRILIVILASLLHAPVAHSAPAANGRRNVTTQLDGRNVILDLTPHSVRTDDMIVRVVHADGTWTDRTPRPSRLVRGEVLSAATGHRIGIATGVIDDEDSLSGVLFFNDGRRTLLAHDQLAGE